MTDEPITWYVSRRVELPLRIATAAFDELLQPNVRPNRVARLSRALTVTPMSALPGVGRRLRGRLAPSGIGGPVPIELELVPWSSRRAELGLRPARRPPRYRAGRYFAAAARALEDLELRLYNAAVADDVAPAPVRRAS